MTNIETLKLALEALTRIWEDGLENFPESGHDAAITALRTAIEQAEKQEPVAWMDASETALSWENYLDGMKPLYTTPPAAPVQEPMPDDLIASYEKGFKDGAAQTAQRQPLTDEKIDDIWNRYCDEMGEASINDAYDIARAIEAAHGIKENT